MSGIYDTDLDQTPANHEPLSPISFIRRAAEVYPDRMAVIHGPMRLTYGQVYERCCRLASALVNREIEPGDTVAILAPNIPAHFEAHYGVPMTGGVLNAINTRLDAATIAFILDHGEAKILLVDPELADVAKAAVEECGRDLFIIDIDDPLAPDAAPLGEIAYEAFLETGDPTFKGVPIDNEWQAIALSYTSGTTGNPKGVVTHHPRCLPQCPRQHDGLGDDAPPGLSLDPAHVPLQRLVFPLDHHGFKRHPCVPAQSGSRRRFSS